MVVLAVLRMRLLAGHKMSTLTVMMMPHRVEDVYKDRGPSSRSIQMFLEFISITIITVTTTPITTTISATTTSHQHSQHNDITTSQSSHKKQQHFHSSASFTCATSNYFRRLRTSDIHNHQPYHTFRLHNGLHSHRCWRWPCRSRCSSRPCPCRYRLPSARKPP